ncbi:MAG TPA: hypothetical protein VFZ40_18760 [Pyrinomonadaceae bacterium]
MSPQLNYDITPDKSPLYTTVDQLNQSTTALTITAQNSSAEPVTINEILVELKKVVNGADTVQLLLPGSESGIGFPPTFSGPGTSTWNVTGTDAQFTLKPDTSVTFQPGDTLSFVLTNVVIREGGTGTAPVPVFEASDSGKAQTEIGIGITQSTLAVQLSADHILIEPGQTVTLKWTTNAATSGVLTMPDSTPDTLTLDSSNLASGQQPVSPIGNTTYSLTCEGRGPSVTRQKNVTIDKVTASIFGSDNAFDATETITLSWQTSRAVSCAISLQENPEQTVKVPFRNGQTVSCNVGATPDGQTLILTSADGSNQELGRLALPTQCPLSVTFVLTAEGTHTSSQATLTVNLVQIQINHFTYTSVPWVELILDWNVSHASSVSVAFDERTVSTSIFGQWKVEYSFDGFPQYPVTITCHGFGGPITQNPIKQ